MNKEFIPYEQALELKELGFKKDNDFGLLYKGDDIPSILYQQAFRWFREKYELCGIPSPLGYEILDKDHPTAYWGCIKEEILESYEEAELACLKKLIEIVKNK
jgi:hypothetical protein